MTVTDLQVMDILGSTGPMSAGQLADLTGLTTGAITGMLDRLEKAGLVRRERDPSDGRRIIVRLAPGQDTVPAISSIFDSMGKAWNDLASPYDDGQLAFLLEFLKRGNELSRQEIVRLRATPSGEGGIYSTPLTNLTSGRLVFSGISQLTVRADDGMAELYQARFEGPVPDVKAQDGVVTIRYPRRLWSVGGGQRVTEVTLSVAVPWQIVIQSGTSKINAELGGIDLVSLEIKGGTSMINLGLPDPCGVVRIRIAGGASDITIRRPSGVAAQVHLKGWASTLAFDDKTFSSAGSDVRMQSPGYEDAARRYDIEVSGSANVVTITSS